MRAKPRLYEDFLASLSQSVAAEMQRRGLTHHDVARRLTWGHGRTYELRRFVRGEHDAIGVESALRVAQCLGLSVTLVRPTVGPRPTGRLAA